MSRARRAFLLPLSAHCWSRALRAETTAISVIAKTPFNSMRRIMKTISRLIVDIGFSICETHDGLLQDAVSSTTPLRRAIKSYIVSFLLPNFRNNAGMTTKLSAVELSNPPKITIAMGDRISLPGSPPATARGMSAKPVERAVISTGPSRSIEPCFTARVSDFPSARRVW